MFDKTGMLAALSIAVTSTGAAAQSSARLSLAQSPALVRASAGMEGHADLGHRHGPAFYLLGAAILGLIVWGAIKLLDNDGHAVPLSP